MDRTVKALAVLLTFFSLSLAGELKACYKAYLGLFPVAETCISYKRENSNLKVESYAHTINVGKVVKRVYNKGWALVELPDFNPKLFFYHQEEGEFKRRQEYKFVNGKIKVLEVHYIKLSEEVERKEEKEYEYRGFVDPYTASLLLYRESSKVGSGTIKMFYDDKEYWLPYGVKGREKVSVPAGTFNTRKVEVHPNVETKGLLRPKGVWYIWVDEEMNIPVKMELKFRIGSAVAKLEKLEGNRKLFEELLSAKR
ncbi:MAG: DUF3108 domain-containing protein [Aquificaceae bacterium]|nr:DUF3108 domain-containing protein [Aquificaceae bacterium]